jgi:hypothetical protein
MAECKCVGCHRDRSHHARYLRRIQEQHNWRHYCSFSFFFSLLQGCPSTFAAPLFLFLLSPSSVRLNVGVCALLPSRNLSAGPRDVRGMLVRCPGGYPASPPLRPSALVVTWKSCAPSQRLWRFSCHLAATEIETQRLPERGARGEGDGKSRVFIRSIGRLSFASRWDG